MPKHYPACQVLLIAVAHGEECIDSREKPALSLENPTLSREKITKTLENGTKMREKAANYWTKY